MDTTCYFISIRFKFNKGLSGVPFFMLLRQDYGLWAPFVADTPYRRNNSKKIRPKYLE